MNVKDTKDYVEIRKLLSTHLDRVQAHFDAAQPLRGFTPTVLEYRLMKAIEVIDHGKRCYFEPNVKDGSSSKSVPTIWKG
jgi:hypothetical protein